MVVSGFFLAFSIILSASAAHVPRIIVSIASAVCTHLATRIQQPVFNLAVTPITTQTLAAAMTPPPLSLDPHAGSTPLANQVAGHQNVLSDASGSLVIKVRLVSA